MVAQDTIFSIRMSTKLKNETKHCTNCVFFFERHKVYTRLKSEIVPKDQRKEKQAYNTSDEDKAAIQSEEGSEAVEETLQIELVFQGTVGSVHTLKLNHPTRQIHTHPLVPTHTKFQFQNSMWRSEGNKILGLEIDLLEMMKGKSFLASFQDIPKILHSHLVSHLCCVRISGTGQNQELQFEDNFTRLMVDLSSLQFLDSICVPKICAS